MLREDQELWRLYGPRRLSVDCTVSSKCRVLSWISEGTKSEITEHHMQPEPDDTVLTVCAHIDTRDKKLNDIVLCDWIRWKNYTLICL